MRRPPDAREKLQRERLRVLRRPLPGDLLHLPPPPSPAHLVVHREHAAGRCGRRPRHRPRVAGHQGHDGHGAAGSAAVPSRVRRHRARRARHDRGGDRGHAGRCHLRPRAGIVSVVGGRRLGAEGRRPFRNRASGPAVAAQRPCGRRDRAGADARGRGRADGHDVPARVADRPRLPHPAAAHRHRHAARGGLRQR